MEAMAVIPCRLSERSYWLEKEKLGICYGRLFSVDEYCLQGDLFLIRFYFYLSLEKMIFVSFYIALNQYF
jgi:hypothetical protein